MHTGTLTYKQAKKQPMKQTYIRTKTTKENQTKQPKNKAKIITKRKRKKKKKNRKEDKNKRKERKKAEEGKKPLLKKGMKFC